MAEARKNIVVQLEDEGLLERVEPYQHSVGHCDRCDNVVEPIVTNQWYVKMEPLAKPARDAVVNGETRIIPERFAKVYFNWMDNIRDWCISRQLWWGHRIPVWYCDDCPEVIVEPEDPTACGACGSSALTQDDDVLDTWFSSGLWTHSTLGWPGRSDDMEYFYTYERYGDGLRHPVLLGGANDDDGYRECGRAAVPHGLSARTCA